MDTTTGLPGFWVPVKGITFRIVGKVSPVGVVEVAGCLIAAPNWVEARRRACWADWAPVTPARSRCRSEEHTSELQSRLHLVCRLLLEKKKKRSKNRSTSLQAHN